MKDNNINSTTKQVLIDLLAEFPELSKKINELQESLTDDMYQKVDERFNRHQYPSSKITYNRVSNLESCPELQQLANKSKDAYMIFKMLIDVNKSPNNLISIPLRGANKLDACNLQYLTGIRMENIRKSIRLLLEYDFLRIYQEHQGPKPAIYMLNPKYCETGKPNFTNANIWNDLKMGPAEFDNMHDYRTQLNPLTKKDAYYDDKGNETLHDVKIKVSTLTEPISEVEVESVKRQMFSSKE